MMARALYRRTGSTGIAWSSVELVGSVRSLKKPKKKSQCNRASAAIDRTEFLTCKQCSCSRTWGTRADLMRWATQHVYIRLYLWPYRCRYFGTVSPPELGSELSHVSSYNFKASLEILALKNRFNRTPSVLNYKMFWFFYTLKYTLWVARYIAK
jgi:hypothetical protein